jgi:hypothetical protein
MPISLGAGSQKRAGGPSGPPTIIFDPQAFTVQATVGAGVSLATATLSHGAGNGTWSIVSFTGPSGQPTLFRLRTTTGPQIVIETSRALTAADVSLAWSVTVSFLGDGLGSPVQRTLPGTVTAGPVTITFSDPNRIMSLPIGNNVVVTSATVPAPGTGLWSTGAGHWPKLSLSATTGQTVQVRTNTALGTADIGVKNIVVGYQVEGSGPVQASTTVEIRPSSGAPFWRWGMSDNGSFGGDPALLEVYKNAFGPQLKSLTIFSAFPSSSTWATIAGYMNNTNSHLYKALAWCKDNQVVPVISLPVCQHNDLASNSNGQYGNFAPVNNGTYDSAIVTFAQRVRNLMGTSEVIFRLGHEPTHFPWRISYALYLLPGGAESARLAWARVATKLREGMGAGANVYTNYCHTIAWTAEGGANKKGIGFLTKPPYNKSLMDAFLEFYPGDAFIDILSWDFYDDPSPMPTSTNYDTWATKRRQMYDFAVARNKLFGVDEWGLKRKITTGGTNTFTFPSGQTITNASITGCGDNADFIRHAHRMFSSFASNRMIYANYFRMFEAGYKRDSILSGSVNLETAVHFLSGRTGAAPSGKCGFQGKNDGSYGTLNGELVGWDYSTATSFAYDTYKSLFHP